MSTVILFTSSFWIDALYENQQFLPKILDYSTMASFALAIVYWNRYTMTKSFLISAEALKSKNSIIKIFNNLPDAVLLVSDRKENMSMSQNDFHAVVSPKLNPTIQAGYIGVV
jgi:hypothetical protein